MFHRGIFLGAPGDGGRLLILLLLLGIAAAAVVALVVALQDRRPHSPTPARPVGAPPSEARRILDERYARGEIDDEEYQRRRDVLSSAP